MSISVRIRLGSEISMGIYCTKGSESEVRRGLLLAYGLPEAEGTSSTVMLVLDKGMDHRNLESIKWLIRQRLPPQGIALFGKAII